MIPHRNISLLSNRLAAGGARRIPEQVLERDYCLAWFLAALAASPLNKVLAFKGGTALKRCYFGDYRFSEDLDFTLLEAAPFDQLQKELERVYAAIRQESGISFEFDRRDRHSHANSYTFYLKFVGPLPSGGDVKVDVTLRELLVFPLQSKPVLPGYPEFTDVPENRALNVYSLEEVASEKTIALADKARNEPRDLYDLWYLTQHAGIDLEPLSAAIQGKLEFRGSVFEGIASAIAGKEARLRKLWTGRLANQMTELPPYDEVFRVVRRELRQTGWS